MAGGGGQTNEGVKRNVDEQWGRLELCWFIRSQRPEWRRKRMPCRWKGKLCGAWGVCWNVKIYQRTMPTHKNCSRCFQNVLAFTKWPYESTLCVLPYSVKPTESESQTTNPPCLDIIRATQFILSVVRKMLLRKPTRQEFFPFVRG